MKHVPYVEKSISLPKTNEEEVSKFIKNLEYNKAPGSDGISSYMIKKTINVITPRLVTLFNCCITKGIFPDALKIAQVVPLHKGGEKNNPTNYRPISLLPQFGKLLEKIIKKRLTYFLDENDIITQHQFGFRESHSTELAIASIHNALLENLDNNSITCTVFLDLAKAFDSVDHEILLRKLEKYGIRGVALKLMRSYLVDRQHRTKCNEVESVLRVLGIGVPQGSVLGPLLFLLFINDLPNVSKFMVKLFADDTLLALSGNDIRSLEKNVNIEMKKISKWFSDNKLTLNVDKSKFMILKRKNNRVQEFNLKYNGKKMERCSFYKYLGVYIDDKLNWTKHVDYLCEKLSKMSGMFSKLRHICDLKLLKTIYYALIESHLQYCNIIWGNATPSVLEPLIRLQAKILRIICFLPNDTENTVLAQTQTKLLNIGQLNKLSIAKFMFKFKNKKLPKCFENFFRTRTGQQRYSLRSRVKEDFICEWGKSSYGMKRLQYEGVQLWNSIETDVRNSNSLREFKNKFKSLLLEF